MPQVRKASVRDAILKSAFRLFSKKGYGGATVPQIAAGAKVSPANVYVYFKSKLEIVFSIYEPWLTGQIDALEREVAAITDPELKLRRIVTALWREIPAANNGFTNNIMQAISTGSREEGYDPRLVQQSEQRISALIERTLAEAGAPASGDWIAHLMFMAFDGFAISHHINPWAACSDEMIDGFCRMLLSGKAPAAQRAMRA